MSIFSSIFRINPIKKLMDILQGINSSELDTYYREYFKFERMKQRYCTQGVPDDKLYPFFSKLTIRSKNISDKAEQYFRIIEREAEEKQLKNTSVYRKYSILVSSMVDLAVVYDFFNTGKYTNPENDIEIEIQRMGSLVKPALHDNPILLSDITKKIENYSKHRTPLNKRLVLHSLINAIKHIANKTKDYVENCTRPELVKFYNNYKKTYSELSKVNISNKSWQSSSNYKINDQDRANAGYKLSTLICVLDEFPGDTRRHLKNHLVELLRRLNNN